MPEYVSSRGLLLAYSATIENLVLTGSAPNTYYLPAEPADGTFNTFTCVKDVPNFGNVSQEMAEHRCLDQAEKFVAKFPTGFLMSDETAIRVAFDKTLYSTLYGYVLTNTQLTWRLKLAQLSTETTPSKSVRLGYLMSISEVVNTDGTEVDATLNISWSSLPKFTAGA